MMQTDVLSGHIDTSGFISQVGRCRMKSIVYQGSGAGAGVIEIYDTLVAPVTATYGRSGATVTVSKTGHGLSTGDRVGIGYTAAGGASGTDGNYTITVVDANSFTITDPNSGTVSAGTACRYVDGTGGRWMTSFSTTTSQTTPVSILIPGEGMLAQFGLYAFFSNASFVTVFYG
jgi:hypothetical protein